MEKEPEVQLLQSKEGCEEHAGGGEVVDEIMATREFVEYTWLHQLITPIMFAVGGLFTGLLMAGAIGVFMLSPDLPPLLSLAGLVIGILLWAVLARHPGEDIFSSLNGIRLNMQLDAVFETDCRHCWSPLWLHGVNDGHVRTKCPYTFAPDTGHLQLTAQARALADRVKTALYKKWGFRPPAEEPWMAANGHRWGDIDPEDDTPRSIPPGHG